MKHQSYIAGAKSAGLLEFIYDVALHHGLRITIDQHSKRIFSETILYTLEGTEIQIQACQLVIQASVEHHNRDSDTEPA